MKILAGDIGGTKTNLALFSHEEDLLEYTHFNTYSSQNAPNLESIVQTFLATTDVSQVHAASFAIAGPVVGNICRATNLPWMVDASQLAKALNIQQVFLLNDLAANAWSIDLLTKEDLVELYPGKGSKIGNRAVVSPGTGLGEAALFWNEKEHLPFACEGGHCEFGPIGELQLELCGYVQQKFGHASYERLLSGPGFFNIYQFLKEKKGYVEEEWLKKEIEKNDPAKVISQSALEQKSKICMETLDLFVSILGSEAANCALKFMSLGGLYLGGGIPPKILPKLKEPAFLNGFFDKGRLKELLEEVPIYVILDQKASLRGAARFGWRCYSKIV